MKYFITVIFSLLTIVVNAQLSMEEISYIPSPSGIYDNLIVKGNARIHEVQTRPFNIQSYSSVLNFNSPKMFVANINVPSTGTVSLSSTEAVSNFTNLGITNPGAANNINRPKIIMNGGNLIITKDQYQNPSLVVDEFYFLSTGNKNLTVKTRDVEYPNLCGLKTEHLYIMGMQVPSCYYKYYWQPVKVGSKSYTVLACNMTACQNPEQEEACLAQGTNYCWKNCQCKSGTSCSTSN